MKFTAAVSKNYRNKIHASVVAGCRRICLRRRHAMKELLFGFSLSKFPPLKQNF
jgi:hypothetical protein